MGLFGKRKDRSGGTASAPAVQRSPAERAVLDAGASGDLDRAAGLVRAAIATETTDATLLGRAALTRRALDDGRLQDALGLLQGWPSVWAGELTDRDHRGATYVGGMLIVDFFNAPGSDALPGSHDLLVDKFRDLAKEVQRQTGNGFFGDVFAATMSRTAR